MKKTKEKEIKGFGDLKGMDYFEWVVLSVIVGIVPLLVRVARVPVSPEEQAIQMTGGAFFQDLFSYQKSVLFFFCASLLAAFFIVRQLVESAMPKWREWLKNPVVIASLAYLLTAVLSSVFSSYGYVVTHGVSERYESIYVLIGYFVVMGAVYDFAKSRFQARLILYGLSFSAAIIGLIGTFQYLKMDFFITDIGHALILPASMAGQRFGQAFDRVYATLYNPNCVGLYTAMMLPVTLVTAVFEDKKKIFKYVLFGISALLLASMIGSRSTGGLMGLAADIVVLAVTLVVWVLRSQRIFSRKVLGMGALILVALLAGILAIPQVRSDMAAMANKILSADATDNPDTYFKDIVFNGREVGIRSQYGVITIAFEDGDEGRLTVKDKNGNAVPVSEAEKSENSSIAYYDIEGFGRCGIESTSSAFAFFSDYDTFLFAINTESEIVPFYEGIGATGAEHSPASIGFEGKEHWGSGRGYIWSRTFPILGRRVLLGAGPDTFVFEFPQYDMVSKTRYLGQPYIIVDKPHSYYLQTAVNTGFISLLALLFIFGFFVVTAFLTVTKEREVDWLFGLRLGILTGVCGYLTVSLTTDSVISVAPVFWAVLGLGYALERSASKSR